MIKLSAITIWGFFFLFLPLNNLFADSSSDMKNEETYAVYGDVNLIRLAQADTNNTEYDITEDELLNDLEDLEEPHVTISDPFEPVNRVFFHFNDKLYFWLLKPAARGYKFIVPEPARKGIKNFFNNLSFPVRFVNCILQCKFEGAGYEFGRFMINSTIGLAGFMDIAANKFDMKEYDEDLGQTIGSYGVGHGFFITWPVLGPSTVTDTIGDVGDAFLDPLNYLDLKTKYDLSIKGVEKVNETSLSQEYEDITKSALDPYTAVKDAYYQYRQNKIKK